jgi:hypothetical protein
LFRDRSLFFLDEEEKQDIRLTAILLIKVKKIRIVSSIASGDYRYSTGK